MDMTSLARTEREALCDLALEVGPDAPTLSGEWTVRDLMAHLLVREGSPAAVGVLVPPLSGLNDLAMRRAAREDFTRMVERLRSGPPAYSPFRLPQVDRLANTLEFFVHHEDVRRAREGWRPRDLDARAQDTLWRSGRGAARMLLRQAPTGVVLERADSGERSTPRPGSPSVLVRGLPSELVLFAFGRQAQAEVELTGQPAEVERLRGADLGV